MVDHKNFEPDLKQKFAAKSSTSDVDPGPPAAHPGARDRRSGLVDRPGLAQRAKNEGRRIDCATRLHATWLHTVREPTKQASGTSHPFANGGRSGKDGC